MKKYQSYKSTGIEWIGDIPSVWRISKFKYVSKLYTGNSLNDDQKILYESDNEKDIPYVSSKDIDLNTQTVNYYNGLRIPRENNPLKVSPKDSFLLCVEGGSSGRKMVYLDREVCFVNKLCSFQSIENTRFQYYFIQSSNFQDKFKLSLSGLIGGVSISTLRDFELVLPPIQEQHQIVQFLDSKTELIDKLISTKERKITLLKEQRTSLINQVVTKGLNPNVKMKDSGVEWVGEIPEHWVVTKFNRYVFFQEGPGLRTFQFTDEGTKVICVTNITENGIDFTYKKFISNEEYLEKYKHFTVQKGDLLLSSSGNSWGKVSEYLEDEKVILNTSTIRLNTLDSKRMNKNLIKYILKSEFVRTQLDILMTGSCQPNFGPTHLNQLIIPFPPIDEQIQIISNIEKHDFEFQKLIQLEQKKIDLLKEYRQSLISEVVTGKIKVTTDE